ncbi:CocE/NonD family hydrolase [Flaviflexus massiliensis]|uniref:CocE/NonD family hydrolase n=1 Tax=Flaviflexus massiliensis TaxID=1522309 RepID=UPI0006D58A63|nr:CocE/NonD family hydrolase [Flaviflexus massiliensis]
MKYVKDFPYETRIVEDWIPLSDGTRLWMKGWFPVTDEPVPALLEYLPYRAGDWTAPRDHERHPYYAGHGYASIRVDIRGHGNSEGIPGDEYDAQEHADGVEVINWIAEQDWCTGKLGMFGISWGGFNSLQLAALRPDPLKAIVTTCSTDDRYDNDVHYFGGSLLAVDMHAWASTMLAFESRPPDPRVWGDDWLDQWKERLNGMEPYLDEWLAHQTRDEFWKHGSVCEDYDSIDAAVMAVGGWYDPYRDTVLRLIDNLSQRGKNVRGLLGPWAHQYPDRDIKPGPHIDFLGETLRWWDHWLKDEDTGVMEDPLLRTWITNPLPAETHYDEIPGRWVAEQSWPSPQITPTKHDLGGSNITPPVHDGAAFIHSPQNTGTGSGRYFPYGNTADLPTDQREDDGRSTTFDIPVTETFEILGNGSVDLRVKSPTEKGQIYARLVDVAPDGSATLVTRGNLNLTAREGRDKVVPMLEDWVDVSFPLTGIGYRFTKGHTLRLSLSTAYWPWIWPQAKAEGLYVDPTHSSLTLPHRTIPVAGSEQEKLDSSVSFGSPVQPVPLDVEYPEAGRAGSRRPERLISHDVAAKETMLQADPNYGGTRIYPDGLHFTEDSVERYWINWDDPTTARTEAEWIVALERPEIGWKASLTADTRIRCDEENFYTQSVVTCYADEDKIFEKEWTRTIPREAS